MAEVRFAQVTKSFGINPVIDPLDLTIHDGEFFTFVGPSGCGKSTILNMIAGLEAPTTGEIYFNDRPMTNVPTKDRDVAMVFQSYALYPHMTVFSNIAFPLRMHKVPRAEIESAVEQTASLLGLENLLQRRPVQLSGGQRQRVALARAIVRKPRVFLLDEPLSNLDAKLRVEMRTELRRLHRELGATTIYVTHDQEEALGLSNRLVVLAEGKVHQCGTPSEVYDRPASIFVAGFLGSPTMNFIPGMIAHSNRSTLEVNGNQIHLPSAMPGESSAVTLGIRPEEFPVSSAEGIYEGTILSAEFVGSTRWVEFTWADLTLKGKLIDNQAPADDRVHFDLPLDKCHFFDSESQQRIEIE